MTMSYNCPICHKAGLPNYTKNSVVCPQCNSNLKAFLLLDSISKPQKSRIGTFIIIGISLLTIVLLGLFMESNSDRNELFAKNKFLNDSIFKMQSNDSNTRENDITQPIAEKQDVIIKYVVRKGDYPYKIARFFYGNGNKYTQIEADNNLDQPYILKVGQILIIKISQK